MSIVPLAGPHHRSMGAKFDELFVKVLCLMDDADAFHETIDPSLETNMMAPDGRQPARSRHKILRRGSIVFHR
jgi:hypothetical protein